MTAPMEVDVVPSMSRRGANALIHISEVDARVEQHTGPDSASRPSAPTRRATDGPGLAQPTRVSGRHANWIPSKKLATRA